MKLYIMLDVLKFIKYFLTLCKPVFYVILILSKILQHLLQNIRKHWDKVKQ